MEYLYLTFLLLLTQPDMYILSTTTLNKINGCQHYNVLLSLLQVYQIYILIFKTQIIIHKQFSKLDLLSQDLNQRWPDYIYNRLYWRNLPFV